MNGDVVGLSSPSLCWGWPASCASSTRSEAFRYHGVLSQHFEDAIFGTKPQDLRLDIPGGGHSPDSLCFAVTSRSQIGIWVGVVFAAVASISAIWWKPYYPIWSLTHVGLGVRVIYALVAHGAHSEKMAAL
jgi:hypothetical protein